jgi:uncharacterized protein DUF4431
LRGQQPVTTNWDHPTEAYSDLYRKLTPQPVETETEAENGEPIIVSSTKIQVAGYSSEEVPWLRALVGKKVMMDGDLFIANTRYHIEPLLINIGEGDFMERNFQN